MRLNNTVLLIKSKPLRIPILDTDTVHHSSFNLGFTVIQQHESEWVTCLKHFLHVVTSSL